MCKIVSNNESEAVILDEASPAPKKQQNARMHWFFTFNNYVSEDIIILRKVFDELCYMYAFQEEKGEEGTPHLQGIISMKKRARWTEFGLPKEIHWEKPINVKDCYKYCTKELTRNGDVFVKNFSVPKPVKIIFNLYEWQKDIVKIIQGPIDSRKVYWFWDEDGNIGKSALIKYCCVKFGVTFCCGGKYSDIMNLIFNTDMNMCDCVMFDIPRCNNGMISYSSIESIKNGLVCNTKYETGYKVFNSPHVVIFANCEPDLSMLSKDRWIIRKL